MMKLVLSLMILCGPVFLPRMHAETKTAHAERAQEKKTIKTLSLTNKYSLPVTFRITHNTMGSVVDAWTNNRTTITGNDKDRHATLQPGSTQLFSGPFVLPNNSPIRITWKNPLDNKEYYQEITLEAQAKNQMPVGRILQADESIDAYFYLIPESNFSVDAQAGNLDLIFKHAPSKSESEKTP